ncbi:MAG: lysophospholipid acyltransferase family protein [Vicinamibacteria bacterium]
MPGRLRSLLDRALALFARVLVGTFFRDVEVLGKERIPRGVPLLLIANHVNSLIDPILVMGYLGVRPRILAKSTLWRHPVMAPLLLLAGAVPVYRRQDDADVSRNLDTFSRCRQTLADGAAVLLFPEGRSHNHPHQLPLKTGAARIALDTEQRFPGRGLAVVPVGLTYEDKEHFGSRVLVFVGDPVPVAPYAETYARHGRTAVRELTARMSDELGAVTISHRTWEEARLVERAAALLEDQAPLSRRFSLRAQVMRERDVLLRADPERARALERAVTAYDRSLAALGLVEADLEPPAPASPSGARGWKLVLMAPALLGVLLNWLPFKAPGWLAGHISRTADEPATYKLLASLLTFPLFWSLEVAAAAALGGPWWALAAAVAAPATGYAALVVFARGRPRGRSAHLMEHERLLAELRSLRARLRDALVDATRPSGTPSGG